MDTTGDSEFDCFGSDSEESKDSHGSKNSDDHGAHQDGNSQGNNVKNTTAITTSMVDSEEVRRRRFYLVEDANLRQMATNSAAEAHRTRRPMSSPDFEVFDTTTCAATTTDDSTFKTDHFAAKGMGLRALRKFSCGDEILREYAVMRVPKQQAAASRVEAEALHLQAVQESFHRLSPETQQVVLDLSNSYNNNNNNTADPSPELLLAQQVLGVYQTNSFLLGGGRSSASDGTDESNSYDENYGGLFLTIARINHSCRPNANHIWRADLQTTLVLATRDIELGDEISITYMGSGECLDTAGRQSYLEERFSFVCGCDMCAEGSQQGGDNRMNELNSQQHEISLSLATVAAATDTDTGAGNGAEAILESVERCLVLLQEQGFGTTSGAFVKTILHYGYQACLLLRRESGGCMLEESERLARSYLFKELVATENGEGVGSPNALKIQDMIDAMPVR